MKRYRWLRAQWPISMRVLAKRLKSKAFTQEKSEGFVLDRVRDDYVEARFFEKVEYDDTVVDPFGGESSFHRVEFRKCEFKAALVGPGLELVDSQRGVQTMISRLAEITEFTLAISPLSVNTLIWATEIQRRMNVLGVVDSIQIGAVELSHDIHAKAIIKGSSDVLAVTKKLVENRKHIVEKVHLRLKNAAMSTVLLTNSGVARFDAEPPDELLAAVRSSLLIQ